MSSVSAVQTPTVGLTQANGLSPDSLVLYLQMQLGDIDTKIDQFMLKQKHIQAQRKELNAMATALAGVEMPPLKDGKTNEYNTVKMDREDINAFNAAFEKIESQFPLDKQTTEAIERAMATEFSSPEQLKGLQASVENAIKDLETSANLDLIQLQSCVSQRNTCISLATNLMSAVGKGEESITGNIGR